MALSHSPKVVTSNLVFYYDIANTKKSNIGDTTTNLISNGNFVNGTVGWSNYALSTVPFVTTVYDFPGSISSAKSVLQCNCLGSIHGGGNYGGFFSSAPVLSSGNTYTVSFIARSLSGNMTFVFSNQSGSGDNSNLSFNSSITGDWQRYTRTASLDLVKNTIYFYNQSVSSGTFQISDIQIEAKSTATTFTSNTRSATQSILDLTGRNTITVSSLTYDNSETFRFNGSSDYIIIPNTQLGNGNIAWTISTWMKTTTAVNGLGLGSIISNSSGGPVYSMMGVNSGKIVYWTYQSSAWAQKLGTGITVNDGNWHMLTWVNYSNSTMDMYVDGILDSNVANSTSGNNNPVDRIGGSWAGFFSGSIATLSRYTRALTAGEVNQNFNALKGRFGI
jgi:hypothetical protein